MTKKYVDGVLVDLTTEEENFRNQEIAEHNANALNRALDILRQKRKPLLLQSDWTDLPNAPLTDEKKSEWQTYRTNLRNITNGLTTVEQVEAVEFPEKP